MPRRRLKRRGRCRSRNELSTGSVPGSLLECATLRSSRKLLSCLAQGGDIHAADDVGLSPLIRAVMAGASDNVLALAEYGAEVNQAAMVTLQVLKRRAIYRINEHLGLQGATDIPCDTPFFLTPLHLAALSADAESIWALVCNGADPHARVEGPLPQLSGSPLDFCARFIPEATESECEQKLRCVASFWSGKGADLDKKVFRLFLHKVHGASLSTVDTRVAQIQRCENLLRSLFVSQRVFLFRNMDVEMLQKMQLALRQMEQFQLLNLRQHGGMENALDDFISYAKSSLRKKYNAL